MSQAPHSHDAESGYHLMSSSQLSKFSHERCHSSGGDSEHMRHKDAHVPGTHENLEYLTHYTQGPGMEEHLLSPPVQNQI